MSRPVRMAERAGAWAARCYEPLLGGILADVRTRAAACCAQGLSGGRVLDVCCGPGGLRPYLQHHGLAVTGIDLDAHMLAEARRREHRHGGVPCLWARADAGGLPFVDGSFDVAVVSLALHAMPWDTATAVLQEMRRVASRIVIADYCLAERNLALPACTVAFAVEWLVGGAHYRCYREFMRRGGLEGILYRRHMTVLQREHTLGGAGMVVVCGA